MPIATTRPSSENLARLRADLQEQPVTYAEVGATAADLLPSGYNHDWVSVEIGEGAEIWGRAQHAVRTWQGHLHAGATITPEDAPLEAGTIVIATVRVGPIFAVAPCRIVYTTAEDDRFGFAYGSLPGHPEQGEEAFHVARDPNGAVTFEIVAFSRPAARLARLGSPVARAIQQRTMQRYLEGVRAYAAGGI